MTEKKIQKSERVVALYLRQSHDPTGEGLAVGRQRVPGRELAAQRYPGREIVEYIDNDVSASGKVVRKGYQQLLTDIRAGLIFAVIVWDLDRLHRQPIELEEFINLADKHGIALSTVTGEVDLSTDNGRLFARIKGAVARSEVERKGARQSLANLQRATAGKPNTGRRPFGYDDDRLTLCEPEAALIKRAYADVLAGVKLSVITRQWQDSGLAPTQSEDGRERRSAAKWTRNSIREILLNARNAGLRRYKGEMMGKATWPGIVDEDTWRSACAILTDPSRRTSDTTARRWLLPGIATCGVCGGPMKAHWSTPTNGTKRRRYLCRDKSCVSRTADLADIVVTQHIVKRLARPDARELLVDKSQPNAENLMVQADTLRRRLEDMASAFAEGEITRAQLATGTEKIKAKLADVEREMAHADRAPLLRDLIEAGDVAAKWETLDLDRQRAVVAMLVKVTILSSPVGKRPQADSIRVEAAA